MNTQTLGENTAAISAEFHQSPKFYEAYAAIGEQVSGFPGLWNLCLYAATEITRLEEMHTLDFSEINWIEFVTLFTDKLPDECISTNTAPGMATFNRIALEVKASLT